MGKSLYIKIGAGIVVLGAALALYFFFSDDKSHNHYTLEIEEAMRFDIGSPVYIEGIKSGEIIGHDESAGSKNRICYLIQLPENIHIPDRSKIEIFPNSDSSKFFINIELQPSFGYFVSGDTLVYSGENLVKGPKLKNLIEPTAEEEMRKDSLTVEVVKKEKEINEIVTEQEVVFKVQVLVSSKELNLNSKKFVGLKDIAVEKDGEIYKYFYKNPNTFEEAVQFQEKAREAGLKDAFVVAYKDRKRISLKEARNSGK